MTLEDHAGDIVRKARLMAGIPAADVASAAGISPEQLESFEQSGVATPGTEWARLAALVNLSPEKLRRIAQEWTPAPIDTATWRELRQITTTGNGFTVHCYLIWDEVTRDAALFDTGWDLAPINALLDQNRLSLQHLFITHTHRDHIAAMDAVRERFPKVRLHTQAKHAPPQHRNRPDDFVHLGSLRITNRDTPGHAEDGVTYIVGNFPEDAPSVAIVGDAIFAGSMGGAPGLGELARRKVREQILSLPPETLICPGHGPLTTVGEQRTANPFFP
jgi:hydroxyacylglutathione hydrolase